MTLSTAHTRPIQYRIYSTHITKHTRTAGMNIQLLALCESAKDALGDELHLSQAYIIKSNIFGKKGTSMRDDNIKRMIAALPNSTGAASHEIDIELINKLGFADAKENEWNVFNILFVSKEKRDAFVKGEGYDEHTQSKIVKVKCEQQVWIEDSDPKI